MSQMKPILVNGVVKAYDWGREDPDSLVYKYSSQNQFKQGKYAELWIGSHPNGQSTTKDGKTLTEIIKQSNQKDIIFLFKILSINKSLSIQLHPTKVQAQQLHIKDPKNYPDNNDKPQLFVTLTQFKAFIGLISQQEFNRLLTISPFNTLKSNTIKGILEEILSLPKDIINKMIQEIVQKKQQFKDRSYVIRKMHQDFGLDVGIIVSFLLNYFDLPIGKSFYLKAGLPHAYIQGEAVQLMKNSDNVVRLGLTPKFKDVETLLKIIDYDQKELTPLVKNNHCYQGGILRLYEIEENINLELQERSLGLIFEGEFSINGEKFKEKNILFIPSGKIEISGKGKLYLATSHEQK